MSEKSLGQRLGVLCREEDQLSNLHYHLQGWCSLRPATSSVSSLSAEVVWANYGTDLRAVATYHTNEGVSVKQVRQLR